MPFAQRKKPMISKSVQNMHNQSVGRVEEEMRANGGGDSYSLVIILSSNKIKWRQICL